jgi:two-component sensor histidine kinase
VTLLVDITERRRAEEQQKLLLSKSVHRIKNTFATIQAVAMQTLRRSPSDERAAFLARLRSLANAHELLANNNWDRAPISDVLDRAIAPFGKERFLIEGPDAELNASKSLQLTMALHELAINAVKYGALSSGAGHCVGTLRTPSPEALVGRTSRAAGLADRAQGLRITPHREHLRGRAFRVWSLGLTCTLEIDL